jgi:hydroxypyruvate isomerase
LDKVNRLASLASPGRNLRFAAAQLKQTGIKLLAERINGFSIWDFYLN